MKTTAALLASALLLLTATARAGDAPTGLTGSYLAGDLGFTVTNDYIIRGGIAFCGSGREVTVLAANGLVTLTNITRDEITCHVTGRCMTYPPCTDESIVFSISKGRDETRWKMLCAEFQAWDEKRATLRIRCKAWGMREDNGLLTFDDISKIQIGAEQQETPIASNTAAIVDGILHRHTPALAMGGSTGWRTR